MTQEILFREGEAIITVDESEITAAKLFDCFTKEPRGTVYVTKMLDSVKILVGIITVGDFKRNQIQGTPLLNTNFTSVQEGKEEEIDKFFQEHEAVTSLPVINQQKELVKEYFTYKAGRNVSGAPTEIIMEIMEEAVLLEKNHTVIFIVDRKTETLLKKTRSLGRFVLVEDITIDMLQAFGEENACVCDFCFDNANIRKIFYEKYHIKNLIWDYESGDSILQILSSRAKWFHSVAVINTEKEVLREDLKKTAIPVHVMDFNRLVWNDDESCFEYIDTIDEEVECILTYNCFLVNPFIRTEKRRIPVLAIKYFNVDIAKRAADCDIVYNILPNFKQHDIRTIVIKNPEHEQDMIKDYLTEDISKRGYAYRNLSTLAKFIFKGGDGDLQLLKELRSARRTVMKDGFRQFPNFSGRYVNIVQNERYIAGNPRNYENTVYICGPCLVWGLFVEEKDTMGSVLRKKIGAEYLIKAISSIPWGDLNYLIRSQKYQSGDIAILFAFDDEIYLDNNIRIHSIIDAYRKIPDLEKHVWDKLTHCDKIATKYISEEIYDICIQEKVFDRQEKKSEDFLIFGAKDTIVAVPEGLKYWLSDVSKYKVASEGKKIGSIVMNCNPFTKGHRYLIEEARKQVDILYIFVVEEDKSFFAFKDRIAMVRLGVKDMENVVVIPSGKHIISTETLPGYFKKEEQPNVELDATDDLQLFAGVIAKEFQISVRFAGEEPTDPFTEQYNRSMEEILPQFGLSFCEIQRKEMDGEVISASRVRKYIKEKEYDRIQKLVLPEIWDYLQEHYGLSS